jgi:putative ABC transport system ATP-binding protein
LLSGIEELSSEIALAQGDHAGDQHGEHDGDQREALVSDRSSVHVETPIHEAMTMIDVAEPSERHDRGSDGDGLVFDETMAGLTLDDVSVVSVGDRPVLVPLSPALATKTGFTLMPVADEVLLGLGVAPRLVAPPAPVVVPVSGDGPGPYVGPVASTGVAPVSDDGSAASNGSAPVSMAGRAIDDAVETARPIKSMAASHLDWEPEHLGWPYIDRRVDGDGSPPDAVTAVVPRSLAAGRPVNGTEAVDLVVPSGSPANTVIIDLQGVGSAFVAPVTLQIRSGSFVVVSGDRGSGKTSLLRLMASYDEPTVGRGVVDAEDLSSVAEDDRSAREALGAGFVPTVAFFVPDLTAAENVELPLLVEGVRPAMARGAAEDALRRVGLGAACGIAASVLSNAETRLASVARALVTGPEIVFADEPFAGLSDDDAAAVLTLFTDLVSEGGTVIMACTDPRVRLVDVRQITMSGGAVVADNVVSATT